MKCLLTHSVTRQTFRSKKVTRLLQQKVIVAAIERDGHRDRSEMREV